MSEPNLEYDPKSGQPAMQRIHEARRAETRELFFEQVNAERSLRVHTAPDEQIPQWFSIYSRIFDAVYDRHDWVALNDSKTQEKPKTKGTMSLLPSSIQRAIRHRMSEGVPEISEGAPRNVAADNTYRDAKIEVLKDMRAVGLGGELAEGELTRIAVLVLDTMNAGHATEKQREAIRSHAGGDIPGYHRDGEGRWRNQLNRFAKPEPLPTAEEYTVDDLLTKMDAKSDEADRQQRKEKPLRRAIDAMLDQSFWPKSTSQRYIDGLTRVPEGPTRSQVAYATRMSLLDDYPQYPTPLTPRNPLPLPETVNATVNKYYGQDQALRMVLYRDIQSGGIRAMHEILEKTPAKELKHDSRKLLAAVNELGDKVDAYGRFCDKIASERMSAESYEHFQGGARFMKECLQKAMRDHVAKYRDPQRDR